MQINTNWSVFDMYGLVGPQLKSFPVRSNSSQVLYADTVVFVASQSSPEKHRVSSRGELMDQAARKCSIYPLRGILTAVCCINRSNWRYRRYKATGTKHGAQK